MMDTVTIDTRKGPVTEEEALENDLDMIPALCQLQHLFDFKDLLHQRQPAIEEVISRHLGIPKSDFDISPEEEWISGSFNICLPVHINSASSARLQLPRRAMFRLPIPFNNGEPFSPGAMDEKLRCEAATYVWLRTNCPDIPIPRLLGMGFPGTQSFTAIENESRWNQVLGLFRRAMAWWHGNTLAPFFAHRRQGLEDLGYLLIEHVEHGEMLWTSWQRRGDNDHRQVNLYRGLAKIMLSLARVPLPRIGSWTMNDDGILSLTNRPLSDLTFFWNKHQIPTGIPRDLTYNSAEPFVQDMLSYQDNRMRHQMNSMFSKADGIFQLAVLTALRTMVPRFWNQQQSREGPFVFSFNDMHQGNIFVDDNWNITSLIDLEFAAVYPVQMTSVPTWISGRGVDQLDNEHLEKFEVLYHQFSDVVREEETARGQLPTYSERLRKDWETGKFWHTVALGSINAFPSIFEQHLQPRFFDKPEFETQVESMTLARLWDENVLEFVDKKLQDMDLYQQRIRDMFAAEARAQGIEPKSVENEAAKENLVLPHSSAD